MRPPCLQLVSGHAPLLSRRELLRVGGAGLAGLSLPALLAADEARRSDAAPAGQAARADALIVLFLNGGPSHLDLWDLKPEAPAEVRGEFQPIASSLPGTPFCEHLPRSAAHLHRGALIRSLHHSVNNSHALAVFTGMTGHDQGDASRIVGRSDDDHPAPGAVLAHARPAAPGTPSYVALPYQTKEGAGGPPQPGFYGGWLGRANDPLWVLKDPNAPDFSVPELSLPADVSPERLAARGALLARLQTRQAETDPRAEALHRFQQQAQQVLGASAVQEAFRLDREPEPVRDGYGRNIYGQSTLLARRLIEAGVRVVTLSWAPDANATWDTHGGNFQKLRETLLPQLDAALGSLLTDLADRGLLGRTLVAVTGDFGRTPKINNNNAGRDHWNFCYSSLLFGGGVKEGIVFGASDKIGAFPADRPVTPGDYWATVYRLLGLDPQGVLHDRLGRPHHLVARGAPIVDLLA